MIRLITLLFAFLLLLGSPENIEAQPEVSGAFHLGNIKVYSVEDGLPDRCINNVFIDTLGKLNVVPCHHVQLGYEQKIYQLDGYGPLLNGVIREEPQSSGTLIPVGVGPGRKNYGIFLKTEGVKVVGARSYFFDPANGSITLAESADASGRSMDIWAVECNNGSYYFLGQIDSTLYLLEKPGNGDPEVLTTITTAHPVRTNPRRIPMHFDGRVLWWASEEGLFRYDLEDQTLDAWEGFRLNTIMPRLLSIRFFEMPDGTLLMGDGTEGRIYVFDVRSRDFNPYHELPAFFSNQAGTVSRYMYEDETGNLLFIQLDGVGKFTAAIHTKDGLWYDYSEIIAALSSDIALSLREFEFTSDDYTRRIFRCGYDLVVAEVSNYSGIRTVRSSPMRGMAEWGKDSVHTLGNRLIVLSGDSLEVLQDYKRCAGEYIYDSRIHVMPDGSWWNSRDNGGIQRRDPVSRMCEVFLDDLKITRIGIESDTTIIYSTAIGEIVRWNPRTRRQVMLDSGSVSGYVNAIHIDAENVIWIASSKGLYRGAGEGKKFQFNQVSLPAGEVVVLTIFDDGQGQLWLGTFAQGLIIYDVQKGRTKVLREESGLSNNAVATIVRDDEGIIWAGTFRGITLIRDTTIVGHIYRKDGLIDNDCNRWSVLKTSDGALCFGTPYGLSVIDPEMVKSNILGKAVPKIFLSSIGPDDTTRIEGSAALSEAVNAGIDLPATRRNLRISYGLSDYAAPDKVKYAYRLGNGKWNFIGNVHDLNLIDLPSGNYQLHIKGADERGQWSVNTIAIPITAAAYFWEEPWFYVLCFLLILFLSVLWQMRQRRERTRLEREVASRTETISRQADALRELDHVKSKLYTNITHEFRTPLTVIEGMADKATSDPKAPGIIKRNVRNLLNLVNQMLDLRKLETGNLAVNLVQADIMGFMKYIGESMSSIAHSRGIGISYELEPESFKMDFDPEKMERILFNLISNAIKFTPRGGRIVIKAEGSETLLRVTVEDTGMGIAEKDITRIFHRYYQVDNASTRRGEGTGIGLTLVSELLQLLGGSIMVRSTPGEGSAFTFSIPVTHNAEPVVLPESGQLRYLISDSEPSLNDPEFNTGGQADEERDTILLVEDNRDVLHYLAGCLRDEFNLAYATDGVAGIDKALDIIPSIIISDVMMPNKTGYELCDTLKQDLRTSHIPIILLTARADLESRIEGLKFGADEYLQKPFDREELEVRIRNLITNRKKMQERYASFDAFPPAPDDLTRAEDAFILRLRSVIEDNIDEEGFGIPELCEALHLGKSHLHKKVRELTGKTPIQYVRSVKLNKARSLLLSSANVSEVAFGLGFSDPKYFARVFKEEFGMTPTEYIRQDH